MEKKDLLANYAASKQNMCITNDTISDRLFQEYGVNRGLRDVNVKGPSKMKMENRCHVTVSYGIADIM